MNNSAVNINQQPGLVAHLDNTPQEGNMTVYGTLNCELCGKDGSFPVYIDKYEFALDLCYGC